MKWVMRSTAGRVIVACCVGVSCLVLTLLGAGALGFVQDAPQPKLFAMTFQEGEELAGFSGRPMLMVFGDREDPAWIQYLLNIELDIEMAKMLKDNFIGVFIDVSGETEIASQFGATKPGKTLIVDIHGPLLGVFESDYTTEDLKKEMKTIVGYLTIEKSPLYSALIGNGSKVIGQLATSEKRNDAISALNLLRRSEGQNSEIYSECESIAKSLGIVD